MNAHLFMAALRQLSLCATTRNGKNKSFTLLTAWRRRNSEKNYSWLWST